MNKEHLELNEYQDLAKRTRNKGLDQNQELTNYAMGLSGETGEVIDILKKLIFHGHHSEKEKLKDELGDVLWYLANLAATLEIELQDIAEYNISKLQKRYPEGFSKEKSKNRKGEEVTSKTKPYCYDCYLICEGCELESECYDEICKSCEYQEECCSYKKDEELK